MVRGIPVGSTQPASAKGLGIDGFSQQMLDKTTKELEQERDTGKILGVVGV